MKLSERVKIEGKEKTVKEHLHRLGLTPGGFRSRLRYGFTVEEALTRPVKGKEFTLKVGGVTLTKMEALIRYGVSLDTVRARMKSKGLSFEKALAWTKKLEREFILFGERYTYNTIEERFGISRGSFRYLLSKGLPVEDIIMAHARDIPEGYIPRSLKQVCTVFGENPRHVYLNVYLRGKTVNSVMTKSNRKGTEPGTLYPDVSQVLLTERQIRLFERELAVGTDTRQVKVSIGRSGTLYARMG